MVVVYSTGCPKCQILKKKLEEKDIEFTECSDVQKMLGLGITTVPVMEIDGNLMDFKSSVEWVNNQGDDQ